jgi:hypothetical protein
MLVDVPSIERAERGFSFESLPALWASGVHSTHFLPFFHQSVIVVHVHVAELETTGEFDGRQDFGVFDDFGFQGSHMIPEAPILVCAN